MRVLTRLLARIISEGTLSITYADGTTETVGKAASDRPDVAIRLTDDATARAILANAALGAGEGSWRTTTGT